MTSLIVFTTVGKRSSTVGRESPSLPNLRSSDSMLVALMSGLPQAMIWSNQYLTSSCTLREKPWDEILFRICMPMDAIFEVDDGNAPTCGAGSRRGISSFSMSNLSRNFEIRST